MWERANGGKLVTRGLKESIWFLTAGSIKNAINKEKPLNFWTEV